MHYVCRTECFWRSKHYKPGDVYTPRPGEKPQSNERVLEANEIPRHFEQVKPAPEAQLQSGAPGNKRQRDNLPNTVETY